MMIASPTAASAAATVITNTTNTGRRHRRTVRTHKNVRLTAVSISSTHMKMIMALR